MFPTRLNINKTRGSLLVDAACCLPVFIVSICLLLSLINQAGREQNGFANMAKRAKVQSDIVAASGLDPGVDHLVELEMPGNGVISKLIYRPFWGERDDLSDDDTVVYVFPKRGIRYHKYGCSTMTEGDRELVLTTDLRKKYDACQICKPGALPNGALVYMYSEHSDVFHRKSCASITKTYETMMKSEAKKKGYSPCMHCMGSEDP